MKSIFHFICSGAAPAVDCNFAAPKSREMSRAPLWPLLLTPFLPPPLDCRLFRPLATPLICTFLQSHINSLLESALTINLNDNYYTNIIPFPRRTFQFHLLNRRRWCHLANQLKPYTANERTANISTSGIASTLYVCPRQLRVRSAHSQQQLIFCSCIFNFIHLVVSELQCASSLRLIQSL